VETPHEAQQSATFWNATAQPSKPDPDYQSGTDSEETAPRPPGSPPWYVVRSAGLHVLLRRAVSTLQQTSIAGVIAAAMEAPYDIR